MTTATSPRRAALRWTGWFAAANAAVLCAVGVRYLLYYPFPPGVLGFVYVALAFVGQFTLVAALPLPPLLVLAALLPRRGVVMAAGAVAWATLLTWIAVDANVFAEQRNHVSLLTAVLFERSTWVLVAVIGVAALLFQSFLATTVRDWLDAGPRRHGLLVGALLALGWLGGQGIHMWADAIGFLQVTQFTRYLPAYYPIHSRRRLVELGLVDAAQIERQRVLSRAADAGGGQLAYPLHPLRCRGPGEAPLNILLVLIDGLRPDAIDPALLPNVAALRADGQYFADHWSGGNSSRMGIFSFFYGLPATYWDAFYGVQQPPVLLDEVRRAGYELGVFSVTGFSAPTDLDRTTFAGVPGLRTVSSGGSGRAHNVAVTDAWLAWLAARDARRPFFGFVYYDPPVPEMPVSGPPLPMDDRFAANPKARELWHQYRLAAQLADRELGRIVADLRNRDLLERTLLVVFSDHGNEFDDSGLGYLGHSSAFTPAQLRATLILRWPGRPPATWRHRTAHQDVPVTLLQEVFGCDNPGADYASGQGLHAGHDWPWLVAGSYDAHAIVEPDRVVVTHAGGLVELLGPDSRPLPRSALDPHVVDAALREMRRFYR